MIPSLGTEQPAARRDALAFERSARAGGGLQDRGRLRLRVLLGVFGEECVAGMLTKTGRPAQGCALREFREGDDADRFERCPFAVSDVLQSALLNCSTAGSGNRISRMISSDRTERTERAVTLGRAVRI